MKESILCLCYGIPHLIWYFLVPSAYLKFYVFILLCSRILLHNVYVPYFHYPLVSFEKQIGCLHVLALVNRHIVDMAEKASVNYNVESFGPILGIGGWHKSDISGSYGRFNFRFLKNLTLVSREAGAVCKSNSEWEIDFSPYPGQEVLSVLLPILAILSRVRWNFKFVLICIVIIAMANEYFWYIS